MKELGQFDCVYLALSPSESPARGETANLVDWKLDGVISRYLLSKPESSVLIPTLRRLPFPWVCLDVDPFESFKTLFDNAKGASWKKILVVTQSGAQLNNLSARVPKNACIVTFTSVDHASESCQVDHASES